VILPAGNSFDAACHAQFELTDANPTNSLQLEVLADDPTDSFVEIWYRSDAEIQI